MRRVVVTGLGYRVLDRQRCRRGHRLLARGKVRHFLLSTISPNTASSARSGAPTLDPTDLVDRRAMRFLAQGGAWNHVAMEQAIADSGLEDLRYQPTSAPASSWARAARPPAPSDRSRRQSPQERQSEAVGPFAVPKAMSSTASATLATWFKIKGVNYSISSACATSAHCIGNAYEMIQWGKQDVMFAGGCEELDWTMSNLFDAMGAMSSKFNDTPTRLARL
jgi:3-oxoacyl-[acyl-carrier-protein] synthase-1